jgi:UMF1 family MFS transporter
VSFWKDRRVWAWAMYDFANSAFATTVLAVVFNVYFARQVVPPEGLRFLGRTVTGVSLWSGLVSFSMLVVFLISPILGAAADHAGRKKRYLALFWAAGVLGCCALFFVKPGRVGLAALSFVLANTGFSGSLAFYNALLPDLSDEKTMGRVSGLGWAVGYIGGGLCLLMNLLMIKRPGLFGLSPAGFLPVRACFLSVGAWWFLFTLPLLLWVPEPPGAGSAAALSTWGTVRLGWERLIDTARHVGRYRTLLKFLGAYLVFNDGIETVILMASIVGAQLLGMSQDELILCFLMIQGVAFVGALVFGELADRLGHKASIMLSLGVYVAAILWAHARMSSAREFWILGAVVGTVLGGSQAASRSFMGLLTPPDRSAEFFSFFGVVGKLTAVLGPLVFGVASQAWGLRDGMLSLLTFFFLGGALLAAV